MGEYARSLKIFRKTPTQNGLKSALGRKIGAAIPQRSCQWDQRTVADILERLEYIGHTVNFRTSKKSFKSKKTVKNDPSEWEIFEDTHEPIVDLAIWERVQEIRKNKRRPNKAGKTSLFSGLLECADCHAKLYFCTCNTYTDESQDHFVCSNYKSNTGTCSIHFIREVTLFNLALTHLQRVLHYVKHYESLFVSSISQKSTEEQAKSIAAKRKTLEQNGKRITELDLLFQRLFEESTAGRISDERHLKLSATYELEQAALKQESTRLEAEFAEEKQSASNTERFLSLVRSYTEVDALSPTILHEFIEKIVVHAPDKSSGKRKQTVEIFYNSIGIIDVPSQDEMVEYLLEHKECRSTEQNTKQIKTA